MTTTIDDETNGFRLALIPMALSSSDLSAQSILHATLAIACYHLGRPQQALKHKFRAIKDLSDSLATASIRDLDAATKTRHFAASMMLCVYGVSALVTNPCSEVADGRRSSMRQIQPGTCILKVPNLYLISYRRRSSLVPALTS